MEGTLGFMNDFIMVFDFAECTSREDFSEINEEFVSNIKFDYPEAGGLGFPFPENEIYILIALDIIKNVGYEFILDAIKSPLQKLINKWNRRRKEKDLILPKYSISLPINSDKTLTINFEGDFSEDTQKIIIEKGLEFLKEIINLDKEKLLLDSTDKSFIYDEFKNMYVPIKVRNSK